MSRGRRAPSPVSMWWQAMLLAALFVLPVRRATAHELQETAITLVVREGGALDLRVTCTWSRLLLASGAAGTTEGARAAVARLAAEPEAAFAARVDAVRRALEARVRLQMGAGVRRAFIGWQWPSASVVQEALRQETMAAMTGGGGDHHASRLTATARLVVGPKIPSVQLDLPPQLGAVLLTVSRPKEQWLAPGQSSPMIPLRSP